MDLTGQIKTCLLAAAFVATVPVASSAQELVPTMDNSPIGRAPLTGGVQVDDSRLSPSMQNDLRTLFGNGQAPPVMQGQTQQNQAPPGQFDLNPMQAHMDRHERRLMRGTTAAFASPPLTAAAKYANPDDAPYRWAQSGGGGYYDTTGTCKDTGVWGDKLINFGGRFFDGTPVPHTPVQVNSSGHIWWQPGFSEHFVHQELVQGNYPNR